MRVTLTQIRAKVVVFGTIAIALSGDNAYSQAPCPQQKFLGTYKRVNAGIYAELTFLSNGTVKIRHAAGFNHVGTYSKVQDKITVVYNLDGKPTELSFEQDDDNTLVHKTNLGNTPIPLSHPYAKESTTRKKTISKGELLGQWKVRKIVPKNTNFFNIPLDQLFIIVSLTLTFTDDGRIVRSDGEILPDMTTYYFNGDQIFVNGKNALHELTCLNGKPILKLTIDGKTENDSNVWHLWK